MLASLLLGVVTIWIFTVIGYLFFGGQYTFADGPPVVPCDNLVSCFGFHLDLGFRDAPIFADLADYTLPAFVYNIAYNFFVILIMAALISGIVFDNLGEIRDLRDKIKADLEGRCFVCGIESTTFEDLREDGFKVHTREEHAIRNYVAFFLYREDKNSEDLTPLERSVWRSLKQASATASHEGWEAFFPIRQALCLRSKGGGNVHSITSLSGKVDRLQSKVDRIGDRLEELVKLMSKRS
eukprot:PLAT6516.1.p1 GENE.PLAT6516.1~~PLAT6516.1.p1  ORF type:complete len:257 (-),score=83.63 PLAT6516.1:28-744(-)